MFAALKLMWADSSYSGKNLADCARSFAGITIEVVKRSDPHRFQLVKRQVGRGADLRLADALPAAGQGLRAHASTITRPWCTGPPS